MITMFIREDENTVSIGVQDQGIGIAENKKRNPCLSVLRIW